MNRRIAVVGGGPGGAFVARLLRLAEPSWEVALWEERPPLQTFGFGVGLSVSTQQSLGASDPDTFGAIAAAARRGHGMRMHSDGGSVRMPGNDVMAIARAQLLQILYRQAEAVGVQVKLGRRVDAWNIDADVVIAADGAGSPTRTARAPEYGASIEVGRQRYIWCGTDQAMTDALFSSVRTPAGVFTTHAYPYQDNRSTFLVETDEATWRAAGFQRTADGLQPGESDETSRRYLEAAFADHLDGAHLLGNNSRWTQFRTVRCARWHAGRVVLLGDAAHTAHYSVGSGTKLAMEDAIVLAKSLSQEADITQAFTVYQQIREPSVTRLQSLAGRSQLWWEAYGARLALPPEQLLLSFLTRAGNVSLEEFWQREPDLARAALGQYAGSGLPAADLTAENLQAWVFAQPLRHGEVLLASRDAHRSGVALARRTCEISDPRGRHGDQFLASCADMVHTQEYYGVELDGGDTALQLLQRLDVAERLVTELGLLTSVRASHTRSADLASGLVAGRTHLVSFS